jgi:hypothetical protein
MQWSDWIALGALAGSVIGGWGVLHERKHRREEISLMREDIALARRQAEREEQGAADKRSAHLVARAQGSSGRERGIDHPVYLRNVGSAPARDVSVWLAEPTVGVPSHESARLSPEEFIDVLVAGDPEHHVVLSQGHPLGGTVPRDGVIVASWIDGNGQHVEVVGSTTVYV